MRLQIPDRNYWKRQINCQDACPVHTDSRGYIRAIAAGEYELAYLIARSPNPLASICGRVCGAPCELACRRGELDKPVSIRALKRFVCDRYGSETKVYGGEYLIDFLKNCARKYSNRPCQDTEELLPLLQSLVGKKIPIVSSKSVGIVGSGPAGLAAAHDLALLGFDVTIYEVEPVLAGMLAVGVPQYRLPRDLINAEVDVILEMGVKAVTGCEVGKDISIPDLRKKHDAVIIAVGAKRSRMLTIPGADAAGVIGGVEYLREVMLDEPIELGQRVVVIGGGNVAYDVGRTALRQISMDTARTAKRDKTVKEVTLCSLESLDEMPADDIEIIEGDEEGVTRLNGLGPVEILKHEDGKVKAVVFQKCLRVFDEQQRFSPLFDESVRKTIECDNVLISIGQAVNISFIDSERDGIEITDRGFVACDPESGKTNAPDVFVAGDLAYGTKLLIHAVASGKKVARAVYQSITGREITFKDTEFHLAIGDYDREKGYEHQKRISVPTADVSERMASLDEPVEKGYDEQQSRCEAGRCFDCGVNTIFDGDKCILCGGCVDVCPQLCLKIVPASSLVDEGNSTEFLDNYLKDDLVENSSVIIKDETICIRCGLCAQRCPTGAITMERFIFEDKPTCPNA